MEHGTTLLAIFHIFVAVILVIIVLLQDSKGGVGGAFGGGSSQTLFGATGAASFLVKVTRGLAFAFMLTCIGLVLLLSHRTNRSVVDTGVAPLAPASANPVTGAPQTGQPVQAPANPAPAGGAQPAPGK